MADWPEGGSRSGAGNNGMEMHVSAETAPIVTVGGRELVRFRIERRKVQTSNPRRVSGVCRQVARSLRKLSAHQYEFGDVGKRTDLNVNRIHMSNWRLWNPAESVFILVRVSEGLAERDENLGRFWQQRIHIVGAGVSSFSSTNGRACSLAEPLREDRGLAYNDTRVGGEVNEEPRFDGTRQTVEPIIRPGCKFNVEPLFRCILWNILRITNKLKQLFASYREGHRKRHFVVADGQIEFGAL